MRRVIVADFAATGHHLAYIAEISRAFADLGAHVTTLTPEPDSLRGLGVFSVNNRGVSIRRLSRVPRWLDKLSTVVYLRPAVNWWFLRRAMAKYGAGDSADATMVFLPWVDDFLGSGLIGWLVLPFLVQKHWAGLWVHPRPTALSTRKVRRALPSRLFPLLRSRVLPALRCRTPKALFSLREDVVPALRRRLPGINVELMPDFAVEAQPVTSHPLLQEIAEFAQESPLVGILGGIEPRKGVELFLESAKAMVSSNGPAKFLLVGGLSTSLQRKSARARLNRIVAACTALDDRLYWRFQRIESESLFDAVLARLSVLWVLYPGFESSSNMLARAAALHIPVVAQSGTLIGTRVEAYGIGRTVSEPDADEAAWQIHQLITQGPPRPDGFLAYSRDHSRAKLRNLLSTLL